MAAGGFKEFVAGEVLDQDEINDFLMQGMLVFAGTAARGSAITAPVEGQFSFLADSDKIEFYDGSAWVELSSGPTQFDFLVIAGGGPGGMGGWAGGTLGEGSGGGGAGGYRCSVSGEDSGGLSSAEDPIYLGAGINYTVTIGAGGVCPDSLSGNSPSGGNSVFGPIISYGGGSGAVKGSASYKPPGDFSGGNGGSGGGGAAPNLGADRVPFQGFAGGSGNANNNGGGGGGAGALGSSNVTSAGGGAGIASSITGSSVTRAVGGNVNTGGTNAGANTGDGGGSASFGNNVNGGNGGSGVVIIKYPDTITLTIGAGLTSSTSSAGGFKVTTFTAGTDVISF